MRRGHSGLGRRRSFEACKTRCVDEIRGLSIPGGTLEISGAEHTQPFDLDPERRSSSVGKSGCHYIQGNSGNDLNCNVKSYDGCSNSVPASPTLMRRRDAICDEIEKTMMILSGRTLRQRKVDMLRRIALKQYCLY